MQDHDLAIKDFFERGGSRVGDAATGRAKSVLIAQLIPQSSSHLQRHF